MHRSLHTATTAAPAKITSKAQSATSVKIISICLEEQPTRKPQIPQQNHLLIFHPRSFLLWKLLNSVYFIEDLHTKIQFFPSSGRTLVSIVPSYSKKYVLITCYLEKDFCNCVTGDKTDNLFAELTSFKLLLMTVSERLSIVHISILIPICNSC